MAFKIDPYTNMEPGQIEIAKAIWLAKKAISCGDNRYRVSKEVEEIIGKIRFWDHEADQVISTTPGRAGEVITLGKPYVLIYVED